MSVFEQAKKKKASRQSSADIEALKARTKAQKAALARKLFEEFESNKVINAFFEQREKLKKLLNYGEGIQQELRKESLPEAEKNRLAREFLWTQTKERQFRKNLNELKPECINAIKEYGRKLKTVKTDAETGL